MALPTLVSAEPVQVSSPNRASALAVLAVEISRACAEEAEGGAHRMATRIRDALERAVDDPGLLAPEHRAAQPESYARRVLYSDPLGRFTILAIVWGAGQYSPPHAHHTWCAYAVHDGSLEETVYAIGADGAKAKPVCTKLRNPGYSCFAGAGLDQIHRLGNSGTRPAISIHVYGVDRERVGTHVNRVVEIDP